MIKHAQILEFSQSTLDKSNLLTARLYVGCDDIGSIPTEINVIIRSKYYKAIIRIEARIMESAEVTVTQEERERAEKNLEGSPVPNQSMDAGEPISKIMKNKCRDPIESQPTARDQAAFGKPPLRVNHFGLSSSMLAATRLEANWRFTWVRDHSNPPTTGELSGREVNQSTLTNGPREGISDFGAAKGELGRQTK